MNKAVNISYFLSHPVQYFSPMLRELATHCNLQVYYFSNASVKGGMDKGFGQKVKWDIPLLEGYRYIFIKNISGKISLSNSFFELINPGLIKHLRNDPSSIVIIHGWGYFSSILTMIAAKLLGKKVWVRAENPLSQELRKGKLLLFIKRLVIRHGLFKLIDKFLYIGKESRKFFLYYGVKEHQLVYTPYAVDNDLFNTRFEAARDNLPKLKSELKLPGDKLIILFSGKYIPQKRPLDILAAFHKLNCLKAALVMVGEGELRPEMESYINENQLQNVYLTGFVNQSAISDYYAIADIFVMFSGMGETWGLSVNEAMNFAKPVVVSSTCGCCSDLVDHGKNGLIVEEGNVEQLCEALKYYLECKSCRDEAGLLSKEIVSHYSVKNIAFNIKEAVQSSP